MLGLALLMAGEYGYWQVLTKGPGSVHAWRQADCLSMTDNLYRGDGNLWNPKTHYAKNDGSRLAAGEFPLVNGMAAMLYKIFGPSYPAYRLLIFAFFLFGLAALFLAAYEMTADPFFSILPPLILFASPVVAYYAISFLPDVPSLALAAAGFFTWVRFTKRQSAYWFLYTVLFFTLAALLKITAAIGLIAAGLILCWQYYRKRRWIALVVPWLAGLALVFIWYRHANQLEAQHPTPVFLTGSRGIWETTALDRMYINRQIVSVWLPLIFPPTVWYMLGLGLLMSLIWTRQTITAYRLAPWLLVLGLVGFFLVLYRQFMWHDYLFVVPLLFLAVLLILARQRLEHLPRWTGLLYTGMLLAVLLLSWFPSQQEVKQRYFQFNNFSWYNADLISLGPELRSHGIARTDLVLSLPDATPNLSLLLMDQYGFTEYKDTNRDSAAIQQHICYGVKYLVVSKPNLLQAPYLRPYLRHPLFTHEAVWVFDLRPYAPYCR